MKFMKSKNNWNSKKNSKHTNKSWKVLFYLIIDSHRPEKRVLEDFKEIWNAKQKPITEGLETGMYELSAVITHLGNSVESGHYMAWVKEKED